MLPPSFFDLRLLGLYLDPQNGKEPMFTAAVRLLHNHGKSLDPMQVLEVLVHYLHQYSQINTGLTTSNHCAQL
jgi:hypothetical protein